MEHDSPEYIEHLRDLLRAALPVLSSYDLMGCGPRVSKQEYEELNTLEKSIAAAIGENPEDYGYHGPNG